MKHWGTKFLGAGILCFVFCLTMCAGVFGAGENEIHVDFEDISYVAGETPVIPGFSVVDKASDGGSILVREEAVAGKTNKYLDISKEAVGGAANDAYIQTKGYHDMTTRVQIGFRIRSLAQTGSINISLRDDNSNASAGTLTLLSFDDSKGKITYGPSFSGEVTEVYTPTQWTEFFIEMNVTQDEIKIYRGDTLKTTLTGVKTGSEKLKNYNYARCSLRLQAYDTKKLGDKATYHFDDLRFVINQSFDRRFFVGDKTLYKSVFGKERALQSLKAGSLTAAVDVKNTSAAGQTVRLAAATYGKDGRMAGVFFSDTAAITAGESAALRVPVQVSSLDEIEKLKMFLFDGNGTLLPLTRSETYVQSEYSQPFGEEIIHDIKQENPDNAHPRILMTRDKHAFLKQAVKEQKEPYRSWYAKVKSAADKLINSDLPEYDDDDELRLSSAEKAADRMMQLAFVYSIEETDRDKYMIQLNKEIKNCAGWPDWNPKHFLDTAALIRGTALAYDWCYDYWQRPENAAQKETLVGALVNMGLVQAQKAFNGTAEVSTWWTTTDNNWAFVCNGGVALGALALGDEDAYADLCAYVLEKGLLAIENSITHFAPDGAWYEGPGYWHYTVRYMSMYFNALQTAAGSDYGYLLSEGISKTAHFPIGVMGKSTTVNLHDASEGSLAPPELFYLAAQFNDTTAAKYRYYQIQKQGKAPSIHDLLWFDQELIGDGSLEGMQLDFAFRDIELMTFRNAYFVDNVYFAALHGGKNGINHGQIDAGNFVYEANGVRWAVDLGGDNYNLHGYFTNANQAKSRWAYYRNRGEGHNTIIINPNTDPSKPADQPLDTKATISAYAPGDTYGSGEIDMQPIYSAYTNNAKRSITLDKTSGLCTVTDNLDFKAGNTYNLYWFMHTRAKNITVAPDGKSAVLEQSGKKLYAYITQGEGTFEVKSATPLEDSPAPNYWTENGYNPDTGAFGMKQNANGDVKKLQIHIPAASGAFALQVTLSPAAL